MAEPQHVDTRQRRDLVGCVGDRLAEMQLRILWEEILKRDLDVEIAGPPVRLYSNFIRGIRSLPVVIRA